MNALSRIQQLQSTLSKSAPSANTLRHIVIVGGGSAGWMSAATLSNVLGKACRITLVESEDIGIVGVGEATIPSIRLLNQNMGVDERAFLRDTQGTIKLGIEFVNWGRDGHRYFHPFGFLGVPFDAQPVYQHWLKHRFQPEIGTLDDYSLAWQAARRGRFDFPTVHPNKLTSTINYAFHFDAALYAQHLQKMCLARGVERTEGKIVQVHRDPSNGFVRSVALESGLQVEGDFFIDCSGFRSLLLGDALQVGFESWSEWLPCDRAWAMPCSLDAAPVPYTRSTALEAGWQWTIPLRHRIGNGYVFSSSFTSETRAADELQSRLPGQALASPRLLKFTPGRRRKAWEHNVLALGLSSGFLEPLESTALHLVYSGLSAWLSLFPDRHCEATLRDAYNRRFAIEMERIRDFLILHYKLSQGKTGEMWRYCSNMRVPDVLQERLALFQHGGHVQVDSHDLFGIESWLAVHLGQLNYPSYHSPLLEMRETDGRAGLNRLRQELAQTAQAMPRHEDLLTRYLGLSGPH